MASGGGVAELQRDFTRALEAHLTEGGEAALLTAYELGRRSLAAQLGVLDVATLVHEALLDVCRRGRGDVAQMVQGAGDFTRECLSPFEMAHRAVREANIALRGLNDLLEEQTRRISHQLHDEAGQMLASVYLAIDDIAADLPPHQAARLHSVKGLLDRVEEQLRRLSHELRPTILDDLGLIPALEFLGTGVATRNGFAVDVRGDRSARLPGPIETVLYRIVQEALNNVAKHARAKSVTIDLECNDRQVRCAIRDDGVGFDPTAVRVRNDGIGLIGIRERLTPLGGTVAIESAPGCGTVLTVVIPVSACPSGHS